MGSQCTSNRKRFYRKYESVMNKLWQLAGIVLLFMATSCQDKLRRGVPLAGEMCDDYYMTLEGDTFRVLHKIEDDLFVICPQEDFHPCCLLKQKKNGHYYIQMEHSSIDCIEDSRRYLVIDESRVYDMQTGKYFALPCSASFVSYLGQWQDKVVLANMDTICFSDGRCVALQEGALCERADTAGKVRLTMGARALDVPFEALYRHRPSLPTTSDTTVVRFNKEYGIRSCSEYGDVSVGVFVDLDIPKGNTESDRAIREWMVAAIKDDAFSLLLDSMDIPTGRSSTLQQAQTTLDLYGELWMELYRQNFPEADSLSFRMSCWTKVRKIVECADYVTYYFDELLDGGGVHGLPRSYYITYDKRQHELLTAQNALKPSKIRQFSDAALWEIKQQYEKKRDTKFEWEEFLQHMPLRLSSMDEEEENYRLVSEYMCDEWSGWAEEGSGPLIKGTIPLPHLAILPEGIVLTYHPYQLDCFAAGEYHVVLPFDKVKPFLRYNYRSQPAAYPKLEHFVK